MSRSSAAISSRDASNARRAARSAARVWPKSTSIQPKVRPTSVAPCGSHGSNGGLAPTDTVASAESCGLSAVPMMSICLSPAAMSARARRISGWERFAVAIAVSNPTRAGSARTIPAPAADNPMTSQPFVHPRRITTSLHLHSIRRLPGAARLFCEFAGHRRPRDAAPCARVRPNTRAASAMTLQAPRSHRSRRSNRAPRRPRRALWDASS